MKNRLIALNLSSVENDIRDKTSDLIESDLKTSRETISKRQIDTYFPVLSNQSLELSGEHELIIKGIKGIGNTKIDVENFADLMEPPVIQALTKKTIETGTLLVETEGDVFEKFLKIKEEAERAWKGQKEIYNAYEGYILDASKNKIYIKDLLKRKKENKIESSGSVPPELSICIDRIDGSLKERVDALAECFIWEIDRIWKENRKIIIWGNDVPTVSTKYINLFGYIKNQIKFDLKNDIGKALDDIEDETVEKVAAEKAAAEKAAVKKAAAEKAAGKKAAAEKAAAKKDDFGKTAAGKTAAGKTAAGKATAGKATAEKATAEKPADKERDNNGKKLIPWYLWIICICVIVLLVGSYYLRKKTEKETTDDSDREEQIRARRDKLFRLTMISLVILVLILLATNIYMYSKIPDYENSQIKYSGKNDMGFSVYSWENYEIEIEESVDPAQRKIRIKEIK